MSFGFQKFSISIRPISLSRQKEFWPLSITTDEILKQTPLKICHSSGGDYGKYSPIWPLFWVPNLGNFF